MPINKEMADTESISSRKIKFIDGVLRRTRGFSEAKELRKLSTATSGNGGLLFDEEFVQETRDYGSYRGGPAHRGSKQSLDPNQPFVPGRPGSGGSGKASAAAAAAASGGSGSDMELQRLSALKLKENEEGAPGTHKSFSKFMGRRGGHKSAVSNRALATHPDLIVHTTPQIASEPSSTGGAKIKPEKEKRLSFFSRKKESLTAASTSAAFATPTSLQHPDQGAGNTSDRYASSRSSTKISASESLSSRSLGLAKTSSGSISGLSEKDMLERARLELLEKYKIKANEAKYLQDLLNKNESELMKLHKRIEEKEEENKALLRQQIKLIEETKQQRLLVETKTKEEIFKQLDHKLNETTSHHQEKINHFQGVITNLEQVIESNKRAFEKGINLSHELNAKLATELRSKKANVQLLQGKLDAAEHALSELEKQRTEHLASEAAKTSREDDEVKALTARILALEESLSEKDDLLRDKESRILEFVSKQELSDAENVRAHKRILSLKTENTKLLPVAEVVRAYYETVCPNAALDSGDLPLLPPMEFVQQLIDVHTASRLKLRQDISTPEPPLMDLHPPTDDHHVTKNDAGHHFNYGLLDQEKTDANQTQPIQGPSEAKEPGSLDDDHQQRLMPELDKVKVTIDTDPIIHGTVSAPSESIEEEKGLGFTIEEPKTVPVGILIKDKTRLVDEGRKKASHNKVIKFSDEVMWMDASMNGNVNVIKYLVTEKNFDPNYRNYSRLTALHNAACEGHVEVCRYLLLNGADPNPVDSDGWTPLHGASFFGDMEIIKLLLSFGANVLCKNLDRESAIMLCESEEVQNYLMGVESELYNSTHVYVAVDYDQVISDELTVRRKEKLVVLDNQTNEGWWLVRRVSTAQDTPLQQATECRAKDDGPQAKRESESESVNKTLLPPTTAAAAAAYKADGIDVGYVCSYYLTSIDLSKFP